MELAIIVTLVAAFLGGLGYAWFIVYRPFRPGLTWLSVVVGCAFTNLAMSVVLWELTHDWRAAVLVPWGCYVLTGAPIMLSQIVKDNAQYHDACRFHEELCSGEEYD